MLDVKICEETFMSVLNHDQVSVVDWKVHWEIIVVVFEQLHCFLEVSGLGSLSFFKSVSWVRLLNLLISSQNSNFILYSFCFRIHIQVTHIQCPVRLKSTKNIEKPHFINTSSDILDQNFLHMNDILRKRIKLKKLKFLIA